MAAKKLSIVSRQNNGVPEILVYGYIDETMSAALAEQIAKLEHTVPLINLKVNSKGGDVYEGIAMFNTVKNAACDIDIYIEGIAASMMSAVALAGRKTYISKYGRIMTHKPSGFAGGNADELRRVANEIDNCEKDITAIMSAKLGITGDEVSAKYLNGKDNFFRADEALALGLVDGIYDGEEVAIPDGASADSVYALFQTRFEAALHTTTEDKKPTIMKQISMAVWASVCANMGITDSVDDAAFGAAVKKLQEKATMYDTVKASLNDKTKELADLQKAAVGSKVTALLDTASAGKKITAELKANLAVDYADNPDGLEKLLKNMPAYHPITDALHTGDVPKEFEGKNWDELMEAGKIGQIKATMPTFYKQLYKSTFGTEPV
jgi:ATP-dependent Clp endopeptidase proteolytic subunit ClpP